MCTMTEPQPSPLNVRQLPSLVRSPACSPRSIESSSSRSGRRVALPRGLRSQSAANTAATSLANSPLGRSFNLPRVPAITDSGQRVYRLAGESRLAELLSNGELPNRLSPCAPQLPAAAVAFHSWGATLEPDFDSQSGSVEQSNHEYSPPFTIGSRARSKQTAVTNNASRPSTNEAVLRWLADRRPTPTPVPADSYTSPIGPVGSQ
jgi:hypothetical protein